MVYVAPKIRKFAYRKIGWAGLLLGVVTGKSCVGCFSQCIAYADKCCRKKNGQWMFPVASMNLFESQEIVDFYFFLL